MNVCARLIDDLLPKWRRLPNWCRMARIAAFVAMVLTIGTTVALLL